MNIRLPTPLAYFDQTNESETRRAIEQALASFGTQGLTFFAELEVGTLTITGSVSGLVAADIPDLYGSKIITTTGATADVDVAGAVWIRLQPASAATYHTFTNVVVGKVYIISAEAASITIDRNGALLIGGVNKTPANGTWATFVGRSATTVTQITEFVASS